MSDNANVEGQTLMADKIKSWEEEARASSLML
jgi:hypothetical protein